MPYRKIVFENKTASPIRRVDWNAIALVVTPELFAQCKSALNGSDKGKYTVFSFPLESGSKVYVSNGREVLESK